MTDKELACYVQILEELAQIDLRLLMAFESTKDHTLRRSLAISPNEHRYGGVLEVELQENGNVREIELKDICAILETGHARPADLAAWRCAELRHHGRLDARIVMRKRLVESTHPDGQPDGVSQFNIYEVGVQYGTEIE